MGYRICSKEKEVEAYISFSSSSRRPFAPYCLPRLISTAKKTFYKMSLHKMSSHKLRPKWSILLDEEKLVCALFPRLHAIFV